MLAIWRGDANKAVEQSLERVDILQTDRGSVSCLRDN